MSKPTQSPDMEQPIEGKESAEDMLRIAVKKAERMTMEEYEKLYDGCEPIPGPTMESPTKEGR